MACTAKDRHCSSRVRPQFPQGTRRYIRAGPWGTSARDGNRWQQMPKGCHECNPNERSDPMSPTAVSSLVGDLVAMAKAAEELPQVEASLDVANQHIVALQNDIDKRDADIIGLQATIDGLRNSLKLTEANRDDAELRFLELEERFGKVASAIAVVNTHMAVADALAKPEVKPQAGGEAPRQAESDSPTAAYPDLTDAAHATPTDAPQGQSATDPTASNVEANAGVASLVDASLQDNASTSSVAPSPNEGVSVPADPTVVNTGLDDAKVDGVDGTVTPTADAPTPSNPTKPYLNKRYSDHDQVGGSYVSLSDWIVGGGSELDYWR